MSHETTLRECPFCGGETWEPLSRRWKNAVGDISYSAYVHCPECEFSIETKRCGYETAEEAIEAATEAWNTRATPGSGKLTAEQVRETVEKHWHDLSTEYDMPEATALPEYSYNWQAIADELNATLGSDDDYERKMDALLCRLTNGKWSKSRVYDLDFMEQCVNEEFEKLYEDELADAALGRGACEMETDDDELEVIASSHEDTWAYKCSACEWVFRYDRGIKPDYCPGCGRMVIA